MKRFSILLLLLCASQLLWAQCPTLVWADEFNGTSLDQTKWNYQIGDGCDIGVCGWGNSELQYYTESNVAVSNGTLKITAKKERIKASQYTSGRLRSIGKGDWTYGRFEARMKLPSGAGLWPAFWMLPSNNVYGGWPTSGEIDIMECVSADPNTIFGTIHYGDPWPNNKYEGNEYSLNSGTFSDNFHTFAVEWAPGEIRWFVDGILYSRKVAADVSPYLWPFDQDFHFLLNLAVGGSLGGTVDNGIFPQTMEVDYVRVYGGMRPYLEGKMLALYQESNVSYKIGNVSANTNVTWAVPAGATIVSGQGSPNITVNFGGSSGNVTASVSTGCGTENFSMYVEVEPAFVRGFSFENFDTNPPVATFNATATTGTLTEVANPASSAVNNSAISGRYVRNAGQQYDLLIYNISGINAADYANKSKKFSLDVYTSAPVGTEIILQLEDNTATASNWPTGRHSRYVGTTNAQNAWQRITFSFLDRPDPAASNTATSKLIFLFASNTFTGDTYYYDNFDSYSVAAGNAAPTVAITSPAGGTAYSSLATISIAANASDSDGSVASVTFYANGAAIGTDNTAPYSVSWTIPAYSNYTLTAVATDNEGATTTSAGVNISASAPKGGKPKRERGEAAEEELMPEVRCYPNPSNGILFVHLHGFDVANTQIAITDLSGKVMLNAISSEAAQGVSIAHLPAGVYLVAVQDGQQRILQRIVHVK